MPDALVLQHVEFEGPARIARVLEQHDFRVRVVRLYAGEAVPRVLPREDLLVIMGGPMGVSDIDSAAHPYLRDEVRLLEHRIHADAPTLGICLGAQLMAFAAGARVYPNTRPVVEDGQSDRVLEVGWADVQFLHATADPVLEGLPVASPMFHWHGDTFDLPRASRLLASTSVCQAQAFRLNQRLFGLQFHCEVERQDVERLLAADEAFAIQACGPEAARRIEDDTARLLQPSRVVGDRLLANIVAAML